jgi:ABC-type nitrate/sulfonate/bicarbonate transport system permease component
MEELQAQVVDAGRPDTAVRDPQKNRDAVIGKLVARQRKEARARWALRVVAFIVVFAGWQVVGGAINPLFLSTPTKILTAMWDMFKSGEMLTALGDSTAVIGIGFGAAVVVGVPLGILMGRSNLLNTLLAPYVNALFVAPRVALVPLILIWFGIGMQAQLVVVFLSCVFEVMINSYAGARNVSAAWIETARSFGAKRGQVFFQVVMPGSVPFIMTGLRLGIGHAVIGMVVSQMFLALSGLGEMLVNYGDRFETANVFGVVIVISVVGVLLTHAVELVEKRFTYWKAS